LTNVHSANFALDGAVPPANYVVGTNATINWWVSAASVAGAGEPAGAKTVGTAGQPVTYAAEVFRSTVTPDIIPSAGSVDFQGICYQVSGLISQAFTVDFKVTGAQFSTDTGNWWFAVGDNGSVGPKGLCNMTGAAAADKMTLTVPSISTASCSLVDGTQICLFYHLTSTSALKEPGKTVTISAELKAGGAVLGLATPIDVAKSVQAAKFTLLPELDGDVYISTTSEQKEFLATDSNIAPVSPTKDENTAFKSTTEVIIGYVKYAPTAGAVGRDGSVVFNLGTDAANAGTLVVTDGQFSASSSGTTGRVYLGTGAVANTVEKVSDKWVATWNLDSTQLGLLSTVTEKYTPIQIKVDGGTKIDQTLDADPMGELTITLGTTKTPISDQPIASPLRRIPYDGKVCTAYNIPSPTGAQDVLMLRITNDSDRPGTLSGTLYDLTGNPVGDKVDLLAGHIDYTQSPPKDRTTLGLSDPLQLQPRETVIITSQNIAALFGKTSWEGERWVLKVMSSIPKIEMFNLLRNVEDVSMQPLSNISTSAKGVECSPIP
jgi:hypothetical protein